jgi:hypothetical protein
MLAASGLVATVVQPPVKPLANRPHPFATATQEPEVQAWNFGQAVPHPPQFVGSLLVFAHVPLQLVCPEGHATRQVPLLHALLAGHAVLHPPQWFGSVSRLTQVPLQLVDPAWHDTAQAPLVQT